MVSAASDYGKELFDHGAILYDSRLHDEISHPFISWRPLHLIAHRLESPTDSFDLHRTLRALPGAPPSESLGEARSLWPTLLHPDPLA